MIDSEEIEKVSFKDRLMYGLRALFHMVMNRPIICYFDDSTIYARTNPFYLQAASQALAEVAEAQIAEEIMLNMKNLIDIPTHRQN